MSELRELAKWIVNLKKADVPDEVMEAVSSSILDTVAASVGAANETMVLNVSKLYSELSGDKEDAFIWSQDKKVPLLEAVFINALAGHTLEMDDVHTESKTHIGTVVIPAAWGVAEYLKKSGEELQMAVLCAYEGMSRIGKAFDVASHRNMGWHVTATAGTFGAAIAAGRLLGLDEDKMVAALGMAGTQSFGRWAFIEDGATCKTLHPARAAASGTEAAFLASAGMTGPEHILNAKDGGLLQVFSSNPALEFITDGLGSRWEILRVDRKPYPCCRSTHCAIEAALELRENGLCAEDVAEMTVETYEIGYKQCGASNGSKKPSKPVEARFSTPYTSAYAIMNGSVNLSTFEEKNIMDQKTQELVDKIKVVPAQDFTEAYPMHWGCRTTVTKQNGEVNSVTITDASGSIIKPLNRKQLVDKAKGMMRDTEGLRTKALTDMIFGLGDSDEIPCIIDAMRRGESREPI